jgi:hypothetical protein
MRYAVLALALLWPLTGHAGEPKLPEGVTCSDVRAHVAQYGKIAAYAWARLQGYSSKEIAEAKRCLK